MGEKIRFDCPNGNQAQGYFASTDSARAGVVVIQEWWGLNPQICAVADKFAESGYAALAPDLYDGRVTQSPDEANHLMTGLDWVGATTVEVAGALSYLKERTSKVAVMGFCMGGALTVIAGAKLDQCDAAVCYYGIPPEDQAHPSKMKAPFQGHFATQDGWCTPEAVDAFESGLAQTSTSFEIHRYDADHAFFSDVSPSYDEASAALSWERTLQFLDKHL